MANPVPGGSESAYLGFAIVDSLCDLLVEKGVLSRADLDGMLAQLHTRLDKGTDFMGKRSAKFIADSMLRKK